MTQPTAMLKGYWCSPRDGVPFKKPSHSAFDAILLADADREVSFSSFCVTALTYRGSGQDDVWGVNYEGAAYGSGMLSGLMAGEVWYFATWTTDQLKPYRVFKALGISRLRAAVASELYATPVITKDLRNLPALEFVLQLSLIEVVPADVCQADIADVRADLQERLAAMLDARDDAACLDCGCFSTAAKLVREFSFDG